MDTNSIGMRVNDDIGLSPRGPHSIGLKKVHGGVMEVYNPSFNGLIISRPLYSTS